MFRDEKLELKVGLFIGLSIFICFLIVFSISDFYMWEKGYDIEVIFDFVNGINKGAPVRLAGVHVGDVKEIQIYSSPEDNKTKVKLDVWISGDYKIEKDAVARINTLGLLGEQYLELSPGTSDEYIVDGDVMIGRDPINVGEQVERVSKLMDSFSVILQRAKDGEGTLGKLLVDDTLYTDLETIFGRIKDGEGTVGKLLTEDKIYDDLEGFVSDIKAHPWKLLHKPRTVDK